jgi:poly-beta-1,6-N-acetyl-D-glucosamine synthase
VDLFDIQFSQKEIIFLSIFLFLFIAQVVYYLFIYLRAVQYKPAYIDHKPEPVSIVICARDEAENLEKNLPSILEQDYKSFEVIVVNDCSSDNTEKVLENLQKKYHNLRTTIIKEDEKFTHGKKLALTIGIKAAKNEWLLLTDADCMAGSKQWLSTMQKSFSPDTSIVLGYSGYIFEKGFLNSIIRFDTFFSALQYMGFAMAGIPYMGVGRNLAYRKSLFFENKGFASHSYLMSGDDDLFINEVATGEKTRVELSQTSHTYSKAKSNFNSWIFQKRRHLTTGFKYKSKHKFLLACEPLSRSFFYLCFIVLLILNIHPALVLSLFFIRLIIQLIIIKTGMNLLKEKKLLLPSLLYDIILPWFNLSIVMLNSVSSKKNKWK